MSRPNFDNDKIFKNLVRDGLLIVYDDGTIIRASSGNKMGFLTSKGYVAISFRTQGKSRFMLAHRLVYLIHGRLKLDETAPIVNHISGIKTDNRVQNLEACDFVRNNQHAVDVGLRTFNRFPCGTTATYERGCRCAECKKVYSEYNAERYKKRLRGS